MNVFQNFQTGSATGSDISSTRLIGLSLVIMALFVTPLSAQEAEKAIDKDDPQLVLAYQGTAVITQQEIDAAFSRIPEKDRLVFIRDGARVDQMVRSLLEIEMLANDAVMHGLMDDPIIQAQVAMAADKELARIWTQLIPSEAPEADFEALAREDYLVNPESYDRSASINLTQILLSTEDRSQNEALELAEEIKSKLDVNPDLFQGFVAEYSDDPAKIVSFGRLENVVKGQMVKPFEEAAFALAKEGDISEPVTTQYGVHLIRLDARNSEGVPSFEAVKIEAIEKQKLKYQQSYLRKYLSALFRDQVVFPEGSVEVMARRHFGENLEKAPVYSVDETK